MSTRRTGPSLCVVLAVVVLPRLWAQAPPSPADKPKAEDIYPVESMNYDQKSQVVVVDGKTVLPDEAVLIGSFLRESNVAAFSRTVVKGKKYQFRFDARSAAFFPGKYSVVVTYRAEDQPAAVLQAVGGAGVSLPPLTYETQIGDVKEQEAFKEQARKKLLDIMHELGRLYTEMHQFAGFTMQTAVTIEKKYKGVLPDESKHHLFREMDKFTTDNWEPRLRAASQDFHDYLDQVAGGFLPEVEKDLDQLIILMNAWYCAFWADVAKMLKLDPPPRISPSPARRFEMEGQIDILVVGVYKGLNVTDKEEKELWAVTYIQNPELGVVTNGTYESYASKFRVSLPGVHWKFDFQVINPSVRLRILPPTDEEANKVTMAVEIRDFPEAKGIEDLNHISEVFNAERWKGYKRLEGKALRASDSTMPGGVRPGYEIICLSDDATGHYKVRDYALYCRWLKRTYSVLCMGEVESFPQYAKEFDAVCKSFAVLDDPQFIEKAHKELEDKKAEDAAHEKGGDDQHK